MRLQWVLLLGLTLGAQAQDVIKRQNDDDTTTAPSAPTTAPPETTSTSEEAATTSSTSSEEDDADTTVFRTVTVTNDDVATVSRATTVFTTITSTIVVTSTELETSTVTEEAETATRTIWETSTQLVSKRFIDLEPRTLPAAEDEAYVTAAPYTTVPAGWPVARPAQGAHDLAKRDTVTQVNTVTVDGDGGATTVFSTAVRTVITRVESETTTTSIVVETEAANARTTVTVTSTLTITSTAVSSGDAITTSDPTSTGNPDSNDDNASGGSDDSGGLSTGAKAGIGAGVGVAGLVVIVGLIWFFVKRRRNPKPEHDDLIGASEVPVGGPGSSGHTPSMAHHDTAAAFLAPSRSSAKPSTSPEGYRGTAMGDGRAGFAKPAPYGAAYANTNSVSPTTAYSQPTERSSTLVSGDALPEHPSPMSATAELSNDGNNGARWHDANAAEIDSRPAMSHQSGPVFEMPTQNYR